MRANNGENKPVHSQQPIELFKGRGLTLKNVLIGDKIHERTLAA